MLKYEKATFEVVELSAEDVIKTSDYYDDSDLLPVVCLDCGGNGHSSCGGYGF